MSPQEHNMAVLGQIVKLIPKKLIEKLKNKYKIQTRSFSATSHVVAMLYAQLSHALSLNDCQPKINHLHHKLRSSCSLTSADNSAQK